jgi:hypothetical protein
LAHMDTGRTDNLGKHRTWLKAGHNEPLFVLARPAPGGARQTRDHFSRMLGHRTTPSVRTRTSNVASTSQGDPHRGLTELRVSAGCSNPAIRLIKNCRGSNRSRMKLRWEASGQNESRCQDCVRRDRYGCQTQKAPQQLC